MSLTRINQQIGYPFNSLEEIVSLFTPMEILEKKAEQSGTSKSNINFHFCQKFNLQLMQDILDPSLEAFRIDKAMGIERKYNFQGSYSSEYKVNEGKFGIFPDVLKLFRERTETTERKAIMIDQATRWSLPNKTLVYLGRQIGVPDLDRLVDELNKANSSWARNKRNQLIQHLDNYCKGLSSTMEVTKPITETKNCGQMVVMDCHLKTISFVNGQLHGPMIEYLGKADTDKLNIKGDTLLGDSTYAMKVTYWEHSQRHGPCIVATSTIKKPIAWYFKDKAVTEKEYHTLMAKAMSIADMVVDTMTVVSAYNT